MEKPQGYECSKKYDVYIVGTGSGCYAENYSRQYVGSTIARTAKQACNNVRYRTPNKANPHGGNSEHVLGDILDEGEVYFHYEAVLAND